MADSTKDKHTFAIRGVVEGFFGPPWSHAARMKMIDFMGAAGYNCYIYAPKDDPFHRDRWREDYPKADAKKIACLAAECAMRGVDFCWALSPGLSIRYSSAKQFQELCAKFLALSHLGVKTFALFLDDIPEEIQHTSDKKHFPSLAAAHADLANRLLAHLEKKVPGARLWFCPTAYFGDGSSPYIATLGAQLDRKIDVFWTGPQVVSPSISAAQARAFAKALGRKPLLWDNYPVNDYNRSTLNIGPLRGRDPKLGSLLAGYFTNPMNEPFASKLPLLTIADYLKAPEKYDPEKSFRAAVRKLCGPDAAAPLELLSQYSGADVLSGAPRPVPAAALDAARGLWNQAEH